MEQEEYYLTYFLGDGTQVGAKFSDINDRDGCSISLDMYKANLGPISEEFWLRTVGKFKGTIIEVVK